MKFKSGYYAWTDIHNAGSIFGTIYSQQLQFHDERKVTLHNEILINRGFPEWQQAIENEKWEGVYSIDRDDKHVKCELTNLHTNTQRTIYADFASDDLLICEAYEGENAQGKRLILI